jgi:small-conductance mechanosensitive channel
MHDRRVVFMLDVTYDTPPATVARIPGIIRSIVETQPLTRFDRSHFLAFAESSLRIETVYYVLDADYTRYADTQHAINLAILDRFAGEGIEFAFPTRTIHQPPATTLS